MTNFITRVGLSFFQLTVFIVTLVLCPITKADRFDYVWVRIWDTKHASHYFPEMDDLQLQVNWLKRRPSFGIAFSGGGTRSAAASLGQLQALTKLGWVDQARYISANSGGSWTVMPYIYLPREFDLSTFLGRYTKPEHLSDQVLHPEFLSDRFSMSNAIYNSNIITRLNSITKGDEAYAKIIGDIFLKPFNLNNRKKLFTFDNNTLNLVLNNNAKLKKEDFYTVTRQTPFPIFVGTLYIPKSKASDTRELFLLESTPLYTGIRNEFTVFDDDDHQEKMLIGGGYIESFGYDSYEPQQDCAKRKKCKVRLEGMLSRNEARTNKRYRFTLSDVIAMSGAAPAISLADKRLRNEIFPEFRHWPIDRIKVKQDPNIRNEAKELKHGDGGDLDNLALMPLLTRRIENILVFINTRIAFPKNADCSAINTGILVDDVISLFRPEGKLTHNVVFDDPNGKHLNELCRQFVNRKQSGDPLVFCDRYTIKDNIRMAVSGDNYRPKICWVYLDRTQKWIDKINPEGGKKTTKLKNGRGDFDTFPHYQTFNEKKARVIDLDRERVHALANLTAWTLFESSKYLARQMQEAALSIKTDEIP